MRCGGVAYAKAPEILAHSRRIALIRRNGTYTLRIMAFSSILDAWRNDGTLAGIEFD